jgi:serine/threonine protein phosphatase PrpC
VREFPLLAAPSQVASAPWRLPGRPSPTGVAADRAEVGDLTVAAASVVGPGHRCETAGLPRQDAYRLGQDTARDHLIVAVADGMSDSEHADVGAAVAVAAAVGRLRTALDQGTGLDGLDARELFRVAAGQLLGAAEQRGWSPDDVRTVMAVAVVETRPGPAGGRRAWLASVADTGVWLRRGRGWTRLTGDAKSGMDGGRLSEFLPHLPDAVRQESYLLAGDDVLAVVTDGLSDLWDQVPSAQEWFADAWAQPCGVVDLVRHVGYEAGQFNDDRTAVVVWCDGSGGGVR